MIHLSRSDVIEWFDCESHWLQRSFTIYINIYMYEQLYNTPTVLRTLMRSTYFCIISISIYIFSASKYTPKQLKKIA